MEDGAPLVHDDFGTNVSSVWGFDKGDSPAPHKTSKPFFDDPDLVKIKMRYRLRRLIPNAMEPRGVVVDPNVAMGEYTMYTSSQIPHIVRTTQAITCGIAEAKLRVVAPDVGGGFGSKLDSYAEESICLALARRLNKPIKWTEERSEGYVATIHGRDLYTDMEMAATRDGEAEGRPRQRLVRRRRVPPDRDARHPDAVGLALRRALRHRGLRLRVHEHLHAHDADRRLPRRGPSRGHLRGRAHAGPPRPRARDGPGRDPSQELHPDRELPQLHHRRAASRSTRATTRSRTTR